MYRLDGDVAGARLAHRVLVRYYAGAGRAFYPIQLLALEACAVLDASCLPEAARVQVRVLEQHQGEQAGHHLFEVAMRHWYGYWFGKRELYGDTQSYYGSGLTGEVFALSHGVSKGRAGCVQQSGTGDGKPRELRQVRNQVRMTEFEAVDKVTIR